MAKSKEDTVVKKPAKRKKKEEVKDDGVTKLEVWDSDMKVFRCTLDVDGHFIDKTSV